MWVKGSRVQRFGSATGEETGGRANGREGRDTVPAGEFAPPKAGWCCSGFEMLVGWGVSDCHAPPLVGLAMTGFWM